MRKFSIKKNKGFSLVEVLIACSIISISIFTIMSGASRGIQLSGLALRQVQAGFLLEEGAEAVKTIRDSGWSNITNVTNNYLSFNTNTNLWSLTQTPNTIDSIFTRVVSIESVNRDSSSRDILESGTYADSGTKKVTIIVSWNSGGVAKSKNLVFYMSDIFS